MVTNISKAGARIRRICRSFDKWRMYSNSRKQADLFRKEVVEKKGFSVVDRKTIQRIKEYAVSEFLDERYWHWLALYSEIRGGFREGWMPNDYYTLEWIPSMNSKIVSDLSLVKSFNIRLFAGHAISPIAVRINGAFYNSEFERMDGAEFYARLKDMDSEIVIKMDCGASGKGLRFKNSAEVTEEDFLSHVNYEIQPVVDQHPELKKLSSSSVNTMRVVSFLNAAQGVECFFSSLRFGTKGARIDNVNAGGLFLLLNQDGDVISNAFDKLGLESSGCAGSGSVHKGFRVPAFREAVEICREQHARIPYARFIAWDIVIDSASVPKIVEWNARLPGMWVNEAVAGPLWERMTMRLPSRS